VSAFPWMSAQRLSVLGTGSALPGRSIDTPALIAQMCERFGFARAYQAKVVADRMAITSRHFCRDFETCKETARPGDSNPELAARAIQRALADAGLAISDVCFLIGHTATPARELPANIALVADILRYRGPHAELRQACTGFASALVLAHGLIATGSGPVAIVGSETGSLFFDPSDLNDDSGQLVNMVQMGDGAGAIIVSAPKPFGPKISATWYGALGLDHRPGISRDQRHHRFEHDFGAIRATGHQLFDAGATAAAALGVNLATAQHIIPHQVSGRIGALAAAHFGLAEGQFFVNADHRGNTGSAAIWIAFDELRKSMTVRDNLVVLGAEASKFMYGGFAYDHG
jgi:3-oxoacyl-[acyl-carrier-protein] synthase III